MSMLDYKYKIFRIACLLAAGLMALMLTVTVVEADGKMPAFSLQSAVDGKVMNSEELKGKTLLITFFATWCPPCRKEIPSLIKLQNKYTSQGFSVIGLSMDENGPKVVRKLIDKEKINYPVLMSDSKTAKDFGGIAGIPTSFLIDREGNVIKRYPGYVPFSMLDKDIKSIL
jgi:peroxiredoxin